ncbi:TIGR02678 family protein [Marinactinospora thermotolerans]|uniref:TIGR02678 family protein n=1 Tax=Marinactinospora thermotolerans DSM 45154 TaxID=1122192 RepID=A0A1T4SUF0_9ACTN|nr:TIGR02678 family protein [Marinactinospora thermotolerans]SKA31541.1 TIGR02678 family protein [Marinactinospora thermotolerans DSM 45154]
MAAKDDIALIVERQTAARRLLADPLVTAHRHPEDFTLVSAHSEWLVQRFQRVLGYRLVVAADHARLVKSGIHDAVVTPLVRDSGAEFTPRSYAYLALALAALVDAPPVVRLAELAAWVREAAVEAGLDLDPADRAAERRAFTAALRVLSRRGVVGERDGSLAGYAADGEHEVRLEVRADIARRVVAHPPHAVEEPDVFLAEAARDDAAGDPHNAELTIRRRLAETAVLYRDDLPAPQRVWLAHHQWRAVAELGELLGCDAEIRAEGIALVLPRDGTQDGGWAGRSAVFPGPGPVGRAALLLIGRLAALLRPEPGSRGPVEIPADLLSAQLADLLDEEDAARYWPRAAVGCPPDPGDVAARVLALLGDARLVDRPDPGPSQLDGWRLLPAAARYASSPRESGTGEADR